MLYGMVTHEKKPGFSEDDAFFSCSPDGSYVLAVLDGLGGAGARQIEGFDGPRTGAYYASRVVRQAIEEFIPIAPSDFDDWGTGLRLHIAEGLRKFTSQYPISETQIKGSLIRNLPTTLALCRLSPQISDNLCEVLWAGDSRLYLLSANHGLMQLSQDDVKGNKDPLENLKADAPLSNFINADHPYKVHSKLFTSRAEDILICATDGCFNFHKSPMHFEADILDCLTQSRSAAEFNDRLSLAISSLTGDDASLVWLVTGFTEFGELASRFLSRQATFRERFMRRLTLLTKVAAATELHVDEIRQACLQELEVAWAEYKKSYLGYWDVE